MVEVVELVDYLVKGLLAAAAAFWTDIARTRRGLGWLFTPLRNLPQSMRKTKIGSGIVHQREVVYSLCLEVAIENWKEQSET